MYIWNVVQGRIFQLYAELLVVFMETNKKQTKKYDPGRDRLVIHQICIPFLLGRQPSNISSLPCSYV